MKGKNQMLQFYPYLPKTKQFAELFAKAKFLHGEGLQFIGHNNKGVAYFQRIDGSDNCAWLPVPLGTEAE